MKNRHVQQITHSTATNPTRIFNEPNKHVILSEGEPQSKNLSAALSLCLLTGSALAGTGEKQVGYCCSQVPRLRSDGAAARPPLKMIHWIIFRALRPSRSTSLGMTSGVGGCFAAWRSILLVSVSKRKLLPRLFARKAALSVC